MNLHDLPPRDQERYLDGVTVGIGTREAGRPRSDRDALDPFHGDEEGWLWRRGFDAGFEGRDMRDDLAALPSPPHPDRGSVMSAVQLRRQDPARNMARFYLLDVQRDLFGQWWMVREFGRIGSPGRVMQKPYPSLDEAAAAHAKLWKAKLKRSYNLTA